MVSGRPNGGPFTQSQRDGVSQWAPQGLNLFTAAICHPSEDITQLMAGEAKHA